MTQVTLDQAMQIAVAHERAGRWGAAESVYRQILRQNPKETEALFSLGRLAARARHGDAMALFQQVTGLSPTHQRAFAALGVELQLRGRHEEAVVCFRRAIELDPGDLISLGHLGECLNVLGRCEESIALAGDAVGRHPREPRAYRALAGAMLAAGRVEDAIAEYRSAVAFGPDYALAHYELATALLLIGRFDEGWREFESRWKAPEFPSTRHTFAQPRWDGRAAGVPGRTVLLYGEQGIGDAIQFVRFLPLVRARGWRVILGCFEKLHRLMRMSPLLGADEVIDQVATDGSAAGQFDAHLPLASLPLVLGELDPDKPSAMVRHPYLSVDAEVRQQMRQTIARGEGRRIGLVWAGNPDHLNDRNRSIALEKLSPLLAEAGRLARLFSFQVGPAAAQAKSAPAGVQLNELTASITDWADSAAAVFEMDLVITVDTAMAHLAGALGRPVWVLLPFIPDFRWMLDRADSPLYPSMRLFRQKRHGDWDGVIAQLRVALGEWAAGAIDRA